LNSDSMIKFLKLYLDSCTIRGLGAPDSGLLPSLKTWTSSASPIATCTKRGYTRRMHFFRLLVRVSCIAFSHLERWKDHISSVLWHVWCAQWMLRGQSPAECLLAPPPSNAHFLCPPAIL